MEIFEKFGINLSVLIAQAVNFLVVLAVLYKFAYKPLLKMLNDREKKIAKSLKEVEEIHAQRKATEEDQHKALIQAKHEAEKIVETAMADASLRQKEILEHTRTETRAIAEKTKADLREAKEAMMKEAYGEVADLVVEVCEKVLKDRLGEESQRERIMEIIAKVSSERH